jgi:hypothetical protein
MQDKVEIDGEVLTLASGRIVGHPEVEPVTRRYRKMTFVAFLAHTP